MDETLQIELEWKLFNGRPIVLENDLVIVPYTIGEIMDKIGVMNYFQVMGILAFGKKQLVEREDWKKIEELTLFEVVTTDTNLINTYSLLFEVVFRANNEVYFHHGLKAFIIENQNGIISYINITNFDTIISILRFAYCVEENDKDSERDDIDDEMAQLLAEFEAEKEKIDVAKGTKTELNYNSIMEGIVCTVPSMKISDLESLNIYQLLRLYKRVSHMDASHNVCTGVYTGSIDAKEIDLSQYSSFIVLPH